MKNDEKFQQQTIDMLLKIMDKSRDALKPTVYIEQIKGPNSDIDLERTPLGAPNMKRSMTERKNATKTGVTYRIRSIKKSKNEYVCDLYNDSAFGLKVIINHKVMPFEKKAVEPLFVTAKKILKERENERKASEKEHQDVVSKHEQNTVLAFLKQFEK